MENGILILDRIERNFTHLGKEEGNCGFIPREFTGVSTIVVKPISASIYFLDDNQTRNRVKNGKKIQQYFSK